MWVLFDDGVLYPVCGLRNVQTDTLQSIGSTGGRSVVSSLWVSFPMAFCVEFAFVSVSVWFLSSVVIENVWTDEPWSFKELESNH